MKKSECIEGKYHADEYFTYGEDGAIYDQETGEKVVRLDESKNPSHLQQLYDNWSNETNDPETQEWRDALSAEELAQVEKWDGSYQQRVEKMASDILSMEAKKDIGFYRIMRDPVESWKPHRSEPMYDDHPDMGSHISTYGIRMPKSGDYLVKDQDGISVRSADKNFEDVRFSAMPSLNEMISSGMVVRVPQHLMEQDLAQQDQLQSLTDQIEVLQQHLEDGKDYIVELRSESASDQRSENMRNAFAEIEKTQAEIAGLEGQLLNLEKEYQKFLRKISSGRI